MTRQEKAVFINFKDVFNNNFYFSCFSKPFIKKDGKEVNKQVKTIKRIGYIFFSVELKKRNGFENQGYILRNDFIKDIQKKEIFTDNIEHSSLRLIEWDDCFLLCFNDGIHISSAYRKLEKKEVFEMLEDYKKWYDNFCKNDSFIIEGV